MNPGSVSVVIPAHNAASYLAEAVASIRAQTAPVGEIVIVDDGSTDATPEVIAGLGPGLAYFRQPKQGAAAARNHGAEKATGTWLTFLDADDLWSPIKQAVQQALLQANPGTEVVFGQGCNFMIAADGSRREEAPRPALLPSAAMMRRDYFLSHARFDETLKRNEAVGWYLQLQARRAVMAVVPELVLWRRVHDTNLRRQGDGGRADDLRLLREKIKRGRGEGGAR